MKRVILVRHATAVKRDPEKPDFNRSLKKSGRKEAREMSGRLKKMKVRPDLFISSPANRAVETAKIFAEALKHPVKKIGKIEKLYEEISPEEFLELIRGLGDEFDSAVVFGHDPSFSEFAQFVVSDFDGDMPKCGVLGVVMDVAAWSDVAPDLARKAFFFYPGDLAAAKARAKALRNELRARIEKGIADAIADFGIDGDEDLMNELSKVSAKLAKELSPRAKGARSGAAPDPETSVPNPRPRRPEEKQA